MIKCNLKKIRDEKEMSKPEFSKLIGINAPHGEYSYLERGIRVPGVDKAIRIARALGMTVEDIWQIK